MEFKSSKGIFQQIADNICDKILSGKLAVGDKIPSVREHAAELGVNHNTIMRTYSELQRDNIISNKRGVGYFVSENAPEKIIQVRKHEFFELTLPEIIKQIDLLKIKASDMQELITKLNENENK
ncbi:GntR family transcriptional regulator [Plebeiibacterium marinum]|uniref:GntR family transcriptional regulator n=1 Tax=Plebeiibacterium marinum TaxID=2992111 RepID=A0AAE3SJR6_9BACT|nr:GntR family transcriptional regulator [Plebeiobacterium marinum]MCW3804655.1 GntR family transcriptional regulator [Plebeiobacterium marinum]